MSKFNRRGFMLAEVVVVSVVIATVLITIYIALNRVSSAYETRNRYYDIDAEFLCIDANEALIINNRISELKLNTSAVNINTTAYVGELFEYKTKFDFYGTSIYYSPCSTEVIKSIGGTNQTFKDYISYLGDNLDCSDYDYVIISEICKKQDDCVYYGLRVRGD